MSDAHRRSLDPRFSFPRAAQPEIVRAFQKDTYYRDLLTSHLNDVVRGLLGTRTLHAHMDIIALAGSTAYFALSSLGGSGQTLGEEYVNAMMVDTRTRRIVRARKRTAFIFLHVLAPFLLTRVYSAIRRTAAKRHTANQQAEQRARMRARALNKPPPPPPSRRSRLTAFLAEKLPSLDTINAQDGWLAYAGAAHLMLFYLGGRYYGVAQRLARVQYISTIAQRPGSRPPSYQVLGVLLAIQLGVKLIMGALSFRSTPEQTDSPASISLDSKPYNRSNPPTSTDSAATALDITYPNDTETDPVLRCTLCMEQRTPHNGNSAVTECGHIFCWDCIVPWANEKPECPLCRQSLSVHRILPVYNL